MGLIVEPRIKNKKILDKASRYNPSKLEKERISDILKDYQEAEMIRNEPYEEFNYRDVIQYMNDSQRAFNSFRQPNSTDPDLAWRSNAVRPITRNRCISIAAHVTATMMYPGVYAQNDQEEEDKDAARVMRDLMDFSLTESKYERFLLDAVTAALFSPAVIVYEGYSEAKRMVKRMNDDGSMYEEEIIDEDYYGYQNEIIPIDEFYIGDIYEKNIQRQPFLIWRRVIDYNTAKVEFGKLENFEKYVRPGLRIFYVDDDDSFYEQYDDDMQGRLVEVVTYYNKYADLELRVINGVLMDDPDRPMQRMDKQYPFAKLGYEPIDEGRFFYYKNLTDKLAPDQDVIDVLYQMIIDGSFLEVMPPMISYGDEHIDTGVMIPGMMISTTADARLEQVNRSPNLNVGMNVLQKVEDSVSESSQDPLQAGQTQPGAQTAFEISRLEANAKVVLGLFGKMIKFFVEDFGNLRIRTILEFQTAGEAMEELSGPTRLKFTDVMVPDRQEEGKTFTRHIKFDVGLNEEKTEEEWKIESLRLQEKEDKHKQDKGEEMRLVYVNPTLFRKLKYKIKIDADFKFGESEAAKKALNLEAYDRAIQNPLANQEAIFKDFLLESYVPGDVDKYVKEPEQPAPGPGGPEGAAPPGMEGGGQAVEQLAGGGEQAMSPEQLAQ